MFSTIFACIVMLVILLSPAVLFGMVLSAVSAILSAVGVVGGLLISGIFCYALKLALNK